MIRLASVLLLCAFAGAALATPRIQQWSTANGAQVYFVPAPGIPMVDVRVVFDAAASRDGDQPGLAKLSIGMLNEGAAGLTATQLTERLDDLGAELSLQALRDMAYIQLRSLSDPDILAASVDTVALMLTAPDVPQDAFDRVRNQMLVGLRYTQQKAGSRAGDALFAELYDSHPYAHPDDGTEESLNALTPDHARAFLAKHLVGANAIVAIVGDLDRAGAERLADGLVGKLPRGERPAPLPAPPAPAEARTLRLEHPGQQTHILLGQPVASRGDPDWFPLYVGNQILGGGGLTSRLSDEVRQQRGLAYSAGSAFTPMRVAGPFLLSAQTRNDQTDQALTVMRDTLRRFVAEGPTPEEVDATRKNLRGGFPLRIASNGKILDYIAMIGFYGLPLDYLDQFDANIAAVTAESVRDAFQRRVDPERMTTVLVGNGVGQADRNDQTPP